MKVCRIICLNLFFLILIVHASARTCEERLESLENAVQSLIENQRSIVTENINPDPMVKGSDRCPYLEKESKLWKRKLEDMEKSLTESNRRIHELETRVSELEFSTQQESRWSTGDRIQSTITPSRGGAAFSAYVSTFETDLSKDHIIKFDSIVSNVGSHYNQHSGVFTAPEQGVYVFSWNLYCTVGGYIHSQLVVNSNVVGAMYTSAQGAGSIRSTTCIIVVQVNAGDVVYVRTHPTQSPSSNLYSHQDWRSYFSGWKVY
ncbi:uncharacterized protein LOC111100440 [Crassostrea virginica]